MQERTDEVLSNNTPLETQKSLGMTAIIGGISGVFMGGVLHPIRAITTRLLVNSEAHVSFLTQLKHMYQHEGPKSYFRGLSCTLSGTLIGCGIYFYLYELLKYEFAKHKTFSETLSPFFAGFLGGFISDMINLPFEVVGTRMQLKPGEYDYKHVFDGFNKIHKHEGVRTLYLGGSIYFTLGATSTSLMFGFYEIIQRILGAKDQDLNVARTIASSAIAASLSAFFTNPLAVLVTRMQSVNTAVQDPHTIRGLVKKIYHNEGPMGFMKGVSGYMLSYVAASVILIPTYEVCKVIFGVDLSH